MLALTGIAFIEKKLKVRTKLDMNAMFLYGTALIFIAGIVEYGLLKIFG